MTGPIPFIVRRILAAIPVLIFITAGTFFLGRFAPGDPVTVRTGGKATPEQVQSIKQTLGLNDPSRFNTCATWAISLMETWAPARNIR